MVQLKDSSPYQRHQKMNVKKSNDRKMKNTNGSKNKLPNLSKRSTDKKKVNDPRIVIKENTLYHAAIIAVTIKVTMEATTAQNEDHQNVDIDTILPENRTIDTIINIDHNVTEDTQAQVRMIHLMNHPLQSSTTN